MNSRIKILLAIVNMFLIWIQGFNPLSLGFDVFEKLYIYIYLNKCLNLKMASFNLFWVEFSVLAQNIDLLSDSNDF